MVNYNDTPAIKPDSSLRPWMQFLVFLAIFVALLFVGTLLGAGIVYVIYGQKTALALTTLDVTVPHFVAAVWILQIAGTTLPIFASPVIFAYALTYKPAAYLKTGVRVHPALILVVLVVMFISNPLIELLSNLNQQIPIPHWLYWMDNEKETEKLMDALLQMKTVWSVIVNVLAVGLLTAIVEEFMFRGVLQTIFVKWTKSVHAAVWITAILFSAFHLEFFGFLPRLLLGVLMGYFVAWSGSIWMGVWAHFINNGTIVVVTYLFQNKMINIDPDNQHVFDYRGYAISFALTLLLLFIYRKIALNKTGIKTYNGEELD